MTMAPALVVMGVAGSGKTTVGELLAEKLGVRFHDADEFHPQANKEKMSAGIPLVDEDRWPWLDAIGAAIRATPDAQPIVVSCSALKRVYRDRIRKAASRSVTFVHLDGPKALLAERIGGRKGHFFPPRLLDSQLATLEPLQPEEPGLVVSIGQTPDAIAAEVGARLKL